MLAIRKEGVEHKTASLAMPLYESMARLHLDSWVQFRSPHLNKGVGLETCLS